jgi:hypothetical protein
VCTSIARKGPGAGPLKRLSNSGGVSNSVAAAVAVAAGATVARLPLPLPLARHLGALPNTCTSLSSE